VNGQRHRHSIRLGGYDYSRPGAYFVTICTHDRACLFGDVAEGEMRLNDAGRIAEQCWRDIPAHFPRLDLDAFVIMPNHVHGIIWITDDAVGVNDARGHNENVAPPVTRPPHNVGATHASPLPHALRPRGPQRRSVASIIGSFKSAVTKRINKLRGTPGMPVWQRNYYEHIIRTGESLDRIRRYIGENPLRWHLDRENPRRSGTDDFENVFFSGSTNRNQP